MWLQRTLLGLVVSGSALTALADDAAGTLRWRVGASPLGLQPTASSLRVQCGTLSLGCDSGASLPLYASRTAPRSVSVEMVDAGTSLKIFRRPGLSVSLVGKAGIAPDLGVYGRVGTTFARAPGLAPTGSSDGGLTYGVGLSWALSRSASAVLGWDSYDVRGVTGETSAVRATSLGLHWRY